MRIRLTSRPGFAGGSLLAVAFTGLIAGCPSLESLPSQAPVQDVVEERSGSSYLLYVPSIYNDKRKWPLVIVTHGTWPYDTADLQMREWASFAENRGIIVAAPRLVATKGDFPPPVEKQMALQRQDEKTLLGVVAEVKRKYSIIEEQVFMTGWSAAAYSILYTGLRNPDVFRALVIRQGSFDARFLDVPSDRFDRWQGIKVIHGQADVIRDQTLASIKWLRDNGMYVDEEEIAGSHRRIDPSLPWRYFKQVAKERMWLRIRSSVMSEENPLKIRFSFDAVPPVTKLKWFFGDGSESRDEKPEHEYKAPGPYEIAIQATIRDGRSFRRTRTIHVGFQREVVD
jgi:predicted esterase